MIPDLSALVARHGYLAVGCVVGLESLGLPLPGETILIAASLYAAASGQLDIGWIVAAAIIGAVTGDNVGFLLGRAFGLRLLERYGRRIGLHPDRLLLGRWLFQRYGVLVVVLGRFTALLRTFAALLAGANRMRWPQFFAANVLGGVAWSCLFGFGSFKLGEKMISQLAGPIATGITIAFIGCILIGGLILRRHEPRWIERAKRATGGQSTAGSD